MSADGPIAPDARACGEFVFEMADWLLQFQIGPRAAHPDLVGGFRRPGGSPGCSSVFYTEAMLRAFATARAFGNATRAVRYREASLAALDYARRLQITPETVFLFHDPVRIVGATTASLSDMTTRCDYDQHTLTCFLAVLETEGLIES